MAREEISVMRLVGASKGYIRGPFFVAGAIYGFVSAIAFVFPFWLAMRELHLAKKN
jgi:cell division protein FtsX